MKISKQLLLIMLFCLLYFGAACQTTTQNNQKVAQAAGLPDGALTRLEEILRILSDGNKLILKSAQKVTNLQAIFELYPSIEADEIWCTLWQSDTFTWGLGVYRNDEQWIDAFNGFMSPNSDIDVRHADVWQAAGCTNFVNPGR